MNRREFLARTSRFAAAALVTGGCAPAMTTSPDTLFRISLAQWSLHRTLRAGRLDNLDFARAAKRDYGIDAVEYVNQFFMDKVTNQSYLREMKARADSEGVRSVLIMCDSEGNLGDADSHARQESVRRHHKWVGAARYLGCHSIRVNAYSQASPPAEHMKLAADGLRQLAEYGATHDVNVIVENHGGISSNGKWLADLIRLTAHPRVGTLPDFGNFMIDAKTNEWYDRYRGVDELMPCARGVSAKSHAFDAAGNETQTDFLRMMKIVLGHGYHGYVGIEYEGNTLSESAGICATRDLLLRVREQLAQA